MNRSILLGLALSGVIANAMSAQAADLPGRANQPSYYKAPQEQSFDWTGFYLGVNGGYGWGRSSWTDPAVGADSGRFKTNGGVFGGQVGYNWQTSRIVLGIESDLDWTNLNGTSNAAGVCATDGGGQCQTQQNWLGTTRLRAGYAFGRWLPYVTGGVSYGNVQTVQQTGTGTNTNVGWAAGAGVEYGIDRNWSVKAELLHVDLGTATSMGSASATQTLVSPLTENLVRAGLNYRW